MWMRLLEEQPLDQKWSNWTTVSLIPQGVMSASAAVSSQERWDERMTWRRWREHRLSM